MEGCLILDIQQHKDRLRTCLSLKKDIETTVRLYEEIEVSFSQINRINLEIITLLEKTGRDATLEHNLLAELKNNCRILYDQLFSRAVKERLRQAQEKNLILSLDESIVYLPWELLYDGKEFLCLKFNVGRSMRIKDIPAEPHYRKPERPLKMLILANPQGNLEHTATEGLFIKNSLDRMRNLIHVDLKISRIDTDYVKKNLRDYDIIHYAGHADYCLAFPQESGWILEDGKLNSRDILKLGESAHMPALVFANACETAASQIAEGQTGCQIYGLARAFLVSGVRHYIATICKVPDKTASFFANEFYANLVQDRPVGEALRLARLRLIEKYGEKQVGWMAYIVFGDPLLKLWKDVALSFSARKPVLRFAFAKMFLATLAVAFLLALTYKLTSERGSCSEKMFQQGKNKELLQGCSQLLLKQPLNQEALMRLGDVFERLGKRDLALGYYFKAAQASDRRRLPQVFIKIGWTHYLKGDYPQAFDFYQKALEVSEKTNNKLSEAVALRKLAVWYIDKEEYEKALQLLLRSSEINRSRQHIAEHRYNLACDYFDLGLVFTDKDDLKTAKEFYDKSMNIFSSLHIISELSDYYSNMAELAKMNKEYKRAKDFYLKSIDLDKKLGNLPSLAATYAMLAELYWEMEDYQKAEENFNKSLQIEREIEDPKGLGEVYYSLCIFHKEKGEKDKALYYLLEAQEIYKNIDTPDYQNITKEIATLKE